MQTSQQLISSFYLSYYGRPADAAGLAYWTGVLEQAGGDLTRIVDTFANSQETTNRFSGMTHAEHIANIYQQLLSRNPEPVGAAYWLGEVTAGRVTIAQLAVTVYNNALGRDALTVEARQQVADQFTSALLANGTDYGGPAGVQAARLIVQAITNTTSPSEISALATAGAALAANAAANPAIIAGLTGANGHLVDLLGTTAGAANPLALVNLLNNIIGAAAGDSTTLPTLLGTGTLTDALTNLPPGVTLTSLNTAITDGGLKDGWVELNPTNPDNGGGGGGGPATPTFVATEANGVITFSGTATGDITMVDNHMSITFMRGGITADNDGHGFVLGNSSKITLDPDQKISATADAVNGATIEGLGSVAITDLQLYSDLSKITTATVTAAVTTVTGTPVQLNSYAKLGKAVVTVSGDGVFDLSIGAVGTASFIVKTDATLKGSGIPSSSGPSVADQLSGATITGTGKVDITGVQSGTDFSKFATELNVKASISSGPVVVSDAAALAVDEFAVGTGVELQLTAAQAVGKIINGAGKVTVSGSDGDQALDVKTTGANTITGGKGADVITLGKTAGDPGAYTGTDVVVVKGGAPAVPKVDSTVKFDVTDAQADTAGTFSIKLAGVNAGAAITIADLAAVTTGETLAAALQTALQSADSNATDITVAWVSDVLTITDAKGRDFSAPVLQEAGTPATPSTVVIEMAGVSVGMVDKLNIKVPGMNHDPEGAYVSVVSATDGAALAATLQTGWQRFDSNITITWADDKLTITDAKGRALSKIYIASAPAEIDSQVDITNGTTGASATPSTMVFDVTNEQAATVIQYGFTIDDYDSTPAAGKQSGVDPQTDGATLAIALQNSLNFVSYNISTGVTTYSGIYSVTWAADKLTVTDTLGRPYSAPSLKTGSVKLATATDSTDGSVAVLGANLDASITTTNGNVAVAEKSADSISSAYDTIINFDLATDKLQLDVTAIAGDGVVGRATITNGLATVTTVGDANDGLNAIATAMGDHKTTVAYYYGGDTYILQNDGVAGLSDADIVIKLAGVQVTDLAAILAGPV